MTKTTSLFRRGAVLAAAACAFAAAGCIKNEQKATVQKDGSGTLTQNTSIDLEAFKKLAEMAKQMGGGGPAGAPGMDAPAFGDDDLPLNMDEIKQQAKGIPGLEITNAKAEKTDGKYTMSFDATFADWSLLGKAQLFMGSADLVKNADGSYTFTVDTMGGQGDKMGGGKPEAGKPEGAPDGMGMDPSMITAMLEPFLGTLEMKQTLTLPGTIVETNGTKSEDGSSVTWKVGFKDLFGDKHANIMKVTFKGEGLDLKPFSYKPDPKAMMEKAQGKHAPGAPGETPPAPPMDEPGM